MWWCRIILFVFVLIFPSFSFAQVYKDHYTQQELIKDDRRLRTAVSKIYSIGIKPYLTPQEQIGLAGVGFEFPFPKAKDYLMNFYATIGTSKPKVVMPLLSLKALEDLTTAYAWLQVNGYSHGVIDIYYTMLRYRKASDFPGGRKPNILEALGIPKDAYKQKGVDDLSLRFRNEAFAFIMAHELAHIYYQHKGYDEITTKQARLDEIQSDRFAMDVLGRTGTSPFGALLFFKAQIYNLTHRGEFKTDAEWEDYMRRTATHPLSIKRIKEMVRYLKNEHIRKVSGADKGRWLFIANGLETVVIDALEDRDLHACFVKIAKEAPLDVLRPRKDLGNKYEIKKHCREVWSVK